MAAPSTPILRMTISIISNTIFVTDAMPRYNKGLFELPAAFKIPAAILYIILNITPPK